jgi:hypothetical protein
LPRSPFPPNRPKTRSQGRPPRSPAARSSQLPTACSRLPPTFAAARPNRSASPARQDRERLRRVIPRASLYRLTPLATAGCARQGGMTASSLIVEGRDPSKVIADRDPRCNG